MVGLSDKQKACYDYFSANLAEWLKDPLKVNKYVVIFECALKGVYDSVENAANYAYDVYEPGEFIIQEIVDENEILSIIKLPV